ncbi:mycofactocin precursor MftA [Jatrophihabitans sp. YIM 134969]
MSVDPNPTETEAPEAATTASADLEHVTEDLLVEDVSIDGMCGVY